MKFRLITIRTTMLAVLLALPFVAGNALAGSPKHKDRLAHYTEVLDLTPAQVDSMSALLDNMRANKKSLKGLDREERRAAKKELKANFRQDLESFLSEKQLTTYDALRERRSGKRHKKHKEEKSQAL